MRDPDCGPSCLAHSASLRQVSSIGASTPPATTTPQPCVTWWATRALQTVRPSSSTLKTGSGAAIGLSLTSGEGRVLGQPQGLLAQCAGGVRVCAGTATGTVGSVLTEPPALSSSAGGAGVCDADTLSTANAATLRESPSAALGSVLQMTAVAAVRPRQQHLMPAWHCCIILNGHVMMGSTSFQNVQGEGRP